MASAPSSPNEPKSGKIRPGTEPTTPIPPKTPGKRPADQIVVAGKTPKPATLPEIDDFADLGVGGSMTVEELAAAALGDDDDDALGLGKPQVSTSGPASGILRPSAAPDDDALSLDLPPAAPGAEASLSFIARSDMSKASASGDDAIATSGAKPQGPSSGWYSPPDATSRGRKKGDGPKSEKLPKVSAEPSDIFTGSKVEHAGDSNLLSYMAGSQGESSNILSGHSSSPSSSLFGDSRVLPDSKNTSHGTSDILGGSRTTSDILSGSGVSSDILAGTGSSRGSSLFDDPGLKTDANLPSGIGSVADPDDMVPLFDEIDNSSIMTNRGPNPTGTVIKSSSPDPIDDDPGMVSFDIPKKNRTDTQATEGMRDAEEDDSEKTSFVPIPDGHDSDDAMASEFLGQGPSSGVNLLGFDHQDTMGDADDDDDDDHVFSGPTVMDMDLGDVGSPSGLNLLSPTSDPAKPAGPSSGKPVSQSSIFSGPQSSARLPIPAPGSNNIGSDVIRGPNSPASIFGPESGIHSPSAIFPEPKPTLDQSSGPGGKVTFDLPDSLSRKDDPTDRMQASGMIDWSRAPADSDQITQRTQTSDQISGFNSDAIRVPGDAQKTARTENDSVFDVNMPDDASTESQLVRAEMYAKAAAAGLALANSGVVTGNRSFADLPMPAPLPAKEKKSDRNAGRRSGVSWIGGTAAGLLAGVGLSAGAYFGGLLPARGEAGPEVAELRQIMQAQLDEKSADADKYRSAVDKARAEIDSSKQKITDLDRQLNVEKSRAGEAGAAVKAANEEKVAAAKEAAEAKALATRTANDLMATKEQIVSLTTSKDELAKKFAATEMLVTQKSQAVEKAMSELAAVQQSLKANQELFAIATKELQSVKLLDPNLDPAAAAKALPAALRKISTLSSSPDARKLADLTTQLTATQASLVASEKKLADQKAAADRELLAARKEKDEAIAKLTERFEKGNAAGKTEIEKAVAQAREQFKADLDKLQDALKQERAERSGEAARYEARLTAQAEEFRQQLTAARAGLLVAATDAERLAADRSIKLFGQGAEAYYAGRYADAVALLGEATKVNPSDARSWYFLGLAHWASGNKDAANEAFKSGGQWESRSGPAARSVGSALERIQGPARMALDAFRP